MAVGESISRAETDKLLSFATLESRNGVEVIDHIERRHLGIETPEPVSPEEVEPDEFEFPVTLAFSFQTSSLSIPNQMGTVIRNSLGFMVADVTKGESKTFPRDTYSLDPGAPVKTYIRFDSSFSISISPQGIEIDLHGPTRVFIGIRSIHQRPAATISVIDDVESVMEAVSHFSSAMKTMSCERSYPTLRGHPPVIEIGDSTQIPEIIEKPDTGISIVVPPEYGPVFSVASLAYYLGANLEPGNSPRIVTKSGFVHDLDGEKRGFEGEVERVLKQTFFLDCITRTQGLFQVNLRERNQIEDAVDLDFEKLYEMPLAEQIERYLDVPFHQIQSYLPIWPLTAHVAPNVTNVEVLSFLVNDLALINSPGGKRLNRTTATGVGVEGIGRAGKAGEFSRTRSNTESAPTPSLVRIKESDSLEQTWIGEGAPMGASKGMVEAFRNRLGRAPTEHDIDITVVCNATEMDQEGDLVNETYGSRDELPFDVSVHRGLTTDELREVMAKDTDFLHYIGHIDAKGFECINGRFNAANLGQTGVDTFLLNACSSYEQGRHLIRSGSIAGVVTLQDVINSGAERIGLTLARLLNCGFPMRTAMSIAREESIMGGHYLVLGDGSISIAQPHGSNPMMYSVNETGARYSLRYRVYPITRKGLGAIFTANVESNGEFVIVPTDSTEYLLSETELQDCLGLFETPLRFDDNLTWSSQFIADELGAAPTGSTRGDVSGLGEQ